jgi:hypothetical protein
MPGQEIQFEGAGAVPINTEGLLETAVGQTCAVPGLPLEGELLTGSSSSIARKQVSVVTGNGIKSSWVITHLLRVYALVPVIQANAGGLPGETLTLSGLAKVIPTSAKEVEVKFVAPPGAGTSYFITLLG